MKVMLLVWNKN